MRVLIVGLVVGVISAAVLAALSVPLALAVPFAAGSTAPGVSGPPVGTGPPRTGVPAPAGATVADIPPAMLELYLLAARRCPGLPWTVLAAIGKVETDHGRGPEVSPAGAEGPMQFMSATWARYGVDGDGDGVASIWDPADAVPAAADLLCANGGGDPAQLGSAIFQYNHADWYVRLVLAWADYYRRAVGA
jgi:hypothetical protein